MHQVGKPRSNRRFNLQHAEIVVINVFGHNGQLVNPRVFPDLPVVRTVESFSQNVRGPWKQICKETDQLRRQVLIEKQLHATATVMLRSRSAA